MRAPDHVTAACGHTVSLAHLPRGERAEWARAVAERECLPCHAERRIAWLPPGDPVVLGPLDCCNRIITIPRARAEALIRAGHFIEPACEETCDCSDCDDARRG